MPSYTFEILPVHSNASPFYKNMERNNDNAGFDLFVPEEVSFQPGERKLVSMGVKGRMVDNNQHIPYSDDSNPTVHYYMYPRSSISKTGLILCNSVGIIDRTYRGEIMAFLWNSTNSVVTVKGGDRLVQIVAPDMGHIRNISVVDSLDETSRGNGGFGSSGR
jgi:dUTP pyrophosphatase